MRKSRKLSKLLIGLLIVASVALASAGTAQAHPRFFFGFQVAPPVVVAPYPYPYPYYPYPYYYPGYYYDPYTGYYYPRPYRLHRRHFFPRHRRFDNDRDDWDRD